MKSATITDVAKHAGVSKKTVSRVINQEANVRAETRKKVQVSIAALGFKRNPLGMALARNRSFFIALLSDNPSPGYLMKLQEGILQSCTEEQMGLFVYDCSSRSQSLANEIEVLVENTLVDGLILAPPICDKIELLEMLDAKNINYIKIGPKDIQSGESIVFNGTKSSYDMTNYLMELGHKDIAFIGGHPDQESSRRIERGFRNAFKNANREVNESLIVQGYYTYQSGIDAAAILLNKTPQPTAIFSANDEMAVGVLYQVQSHGLRVPDDISICGIDDISITTKVWPHITTMRQPLLSIGYQAASLLIKRLKNKKSGVPPKGLDEARIIDGELVIRDSTISFK